MKINSLILIQNDLHKPWRIKFANQPPRPKESSDGFTYLSTIDFPAAAEVLDKSKINSLSFDDQKELNEIKSLIIAVSSKGGRRIRRGVLSNQIISFLEFKGYKVEFKKGNNKTYTLITW